MIAVGRPDIGPLEAQYVADAVARNEISKGVYQRRFEELLCGWTGHQYAVGVSSGTDALHLALRARSVADGAVVVPTLTFAAVAAAVVHAGARPVFVGCLPNGCMDPALVRKAMTPRTRAVVAVHSYGVRCDVDAVTEAAGGVPVIVDASQGHGIQSPGHTEIVSFHGNKVATCGEGGAVVTDDEWIAQFVRLMSTHAQSDLRAFWHVAIGYNAKLTNLQAAVGCAQLERFSELVARRTAVADMYRERLGDLVFGFDTPWLVSVMTDRREKICRALDCRSIEYRRWFPPIHTMPPYVGCDYVPGGCEQTLSDRGLSLPTYGGMTPEDIDTVCDVVLEALALR